MFRDGPFDVMRLGFEVARLGIEAQGVVWLRGLGMAGVWDTPFDEGWRMVAEKQAAFVKSGSEVLEGAVAGRSPLQTARAALAPLDTAATDNRRRLATRGPRKLNP